MNAEKYREELEEKLISIKNSHIRAFMLLDEAETRKFTYKNIQEWADEWADYVSISPPYEVTRSDSSKEYYRFLIKKNAFALTLTVSTYSSPDDDKVRRTRESITVYSKLFYKIRSRNKLDEKLIDVFEVSKVMKKIKEAEKLPWNARAAKVSSLKEKVSNTEGGKAALRKGKRAISSSKIVRGTRHN